MEKLHKVEKSGIPGSHGIQFTISPTKKQAIHAIDTTGDGQPFNGMQGMASSAVHIISALCHSDRYQILKIFLSGLFHNKYLQKVKILNFSACFRPLLWVDCYSSTSLQFFSAHSLNCFTFISHTFCVH